MLGISSAEDTGPLPNYPGLTSTLMMFKAGTYTSTSAKNLSPYRTLNVMLEEINTETNKYNGVPSMVLSVIDVDICRFGDIVTVI